MPELAPNTLIDGRYRVISRLGAGGMAEVFLAEDQQLGRKVALKLLYRRFAEDPGFVERFRREAQAAAGLQHPNVVSVYDRGTFDDTYYIAMEYLPGRSLKQVIRQEAPLDPIRAIDLTIQILKAARFAHRRGVIHRDLKPHNVIVDDSGHAKVTDFGIARAGASDMTETGSIMGTAQYLSPEQAQGHPVSAGSDLYSVGVVLYELLTGRVPFDGESAVTIALKHVSEAPPPPSVFNPSIPPELEQVVMWTLNKNPADRPTHADQFINALEQARASILSGAGGQHTASMAAIAAAGGDGMAFDGAIAPVFVPDIAPDGYTRPPENGTGAPIEDPSRDRPGRGPSPWLWLLLVLLLLAGGGVAAYLLTRPVKDVVPTVVNEMLSTATTQVQNAGFSVAIINLTSNHPAGIVFHQDPQPGTMADQGSTVTLTVSQGLGNETVPSVEGYPLGDAERMIKAARLKVGRVVSQISAQFPPGQVTGTAPAGGQSVPVGTVVTVFTSSGKPQVTVPQVTGQPQSTAAATLASDGFHVTTTTQTSSTVTAGNVISQSPSSGLSVAPGTTVNLVIATAPTTASVPNVQGENLAGASNSLDAVGLRISHTVKDVTKPNQDGIVISQDPSPGTVVNNKSTVTVVVGNYTPPNTTTTTTKTSTSTSTRNTTTTSPTSSSTTTP
jgi:beta-lactam-binding protein with PASTA domain/predicted Ser/Thr protein kinase